MVIICVYYQKNVLGICSEGYFGCNLILLFYDFLIFKSIVIWFNYEVICDCYIELDRYLLIYVIYMLV